MNNELVFLLHTIIISITALGALRLGSQALVAFICTQCILANLFVIKQTTLFGMTATCADAYTVGSVIGLNLLQEYFGKGQAKKAIWSSFLLLLFYTVVSQLHLYYFPTMADTAHQHFQPILQFMPRIAIASLIVYFLVQQLDTWLYGVLKEKLAGKFLVVRNYASILICQLIDTVLFSFLGLYGIIDNIFQVMVISYAIKVVAILCATPFVALSKKVSE